MVTAARIAARHHAAAHRGQVGFLDGELHIADVGLGTACWTGTWERERFASHATIVDAFAAMWVDARRGCGPRRESEVPGNAAAVDEPASMGLAGPHGDRAVPAPMTATVCRPARARLVASGRVRIRSLHCDRPHDGHKGAPAHRSLVGGALVAMTTGCRDVQPDGCTSAVHCSVRATRRAQSMSQPPRRHSRTAQAQLQRPSSRAPQEPLVLVWSSTGLCPLFPYPHSLSLSAPRTMTEQVRNVYGSLHLLVPNGVGGRLCLGCRPTVP